MTEEPVDEPGTEELSDDVVDDLEESVDEAQAETERVRTGLDGVDSVVDDVARLAGQPVEEHVAVFESAHERLRRTLDDPEPPSDPTKNPDPMPPRRLRLDAELVRRGLARSREHATELIAAGRVRVSGAPATKPATGVTTDVAIVVREDEGKPDYVSRGGHKLAGALAAFEPEGLVVAGRRCLDAGASTGGFTDVLLKHGATQVVAVDVGYGQLAWSLRSDERVVIHDRQNVRDLTVRGDRRARSTWWSGTSRSSRCGWSSTRCSVSPTRTATWR